MRKVKVFSLLALACVCGGCLIGGEHGVTANADTADFPCAYEAKAANADSSIRIMKYDRFIG